MIASERIWLLTTLQHTNTSDWALAFKFASCKYEHFCRAAPCRGLCTGFHRKKILSQQKNIEEQHTTNNNQTTKQQHETTMNKIEKWNSLSVYVRERARFFIFRLYITHTIWIEKEHMDHPRRDKMTNSQLSCLDFIAAAWEMFRCDCEFFGGSGFARAAMNWPLASCSWLRWWWWWTEVAWYCRSSCLDESLSLCAHTQLTSLRWWFFVCTFKLCNKSAISQNSPATSLIANTRTEFLKPYILNVCRSPPHLNECASTAFWNWLHSQNWAMLKLTCECF